MAFTPRSAGRTHGPVLRRRAAFTLVELLIGITIIATLIGLLLPVLAGARNAAHGAACLSNLRQHAAAWLNQQQDHRFFPYERQDNQITHRWDWGGVNWYEPGSNPRAERLVSGPRPLNPYYDIPRVHRADHGVFECPADTGLKYSPNTPYFSDQDVVGLAKSANPTTLYGVRGSSYLANEWIWVKPGARAGPGGNTVQGAEYFTTKNSIADITDPSRFILVGDGGSFVAGRMGPDRFNYRIRDNFGRVIEGSSWQYSWWHGTQRGQMAFLDGSARAIDIVPNRGSTSEYMWWLDPKKHLFEGGSATVGLHGGAPHGWDPRGHRPAPEEGDDE